MRILVLILASDNQPIYVELQSIWRKYMKSNPSVDCYFYKGDPTLETDVKLEGDTLWIRIEESLDTVYEKTLKAFEYFAGTYDFVFRTNLSSFIDLEKYVNYCRTIPTSRFVSAFVGYYDNYTFPSGAGFTMSSDVVLDLVKDRPTHMFLDDVTIGRWLYQKGIPIQPVPRCDYTNDSGLPEYRNGNSDNTFHYRIKNANRALDIEIHERLFGKIYLPVQTFTKGVLYTLRLL